MIQSIIHQGDVRSVLVGIADESVHCVVTSPPYWNLRDYGTGTWEGGSPECDHVYNHGVQGSDGDRSTRTFTAQAVYRDVCKKCQAVRVDEQIGLEKTPEEYIEKMVLVFREVRRVLREDGTIWVNIGDSYCPTGGNREGCSGNGPNSCVGPTADAAMPKIGRVEQRRNLISVGMKPKDLVGIPWMLAFALRADGWYLRSEIIWQKPNPMPESVKDRPTKAHEQVFLLSKSQSYYYDAEAIMEKASEDTHARYARGRSNNHKYADGGPGTGIKMNTSFSAAVKDVVENRNKRSVWTIPTQPFPEAHFATFPEKLVEPCILAGCPKEGTVLDPFCGSGTVGLVARRLGCSFVGIELNPEYIAIANRRLSQEVIEFSSTGIPQD